MHKRTIVCIAAALFFSLAAQPGLAQMAPSQQNAGLFTGKDAEAVIADALVKAGAGEDIKVSISEARGDDVITSAAGIVSAETDGLEIDKAHSRWQAILLLRADGKNLAPIRLSGRYDEMMAVPILKRRIQANEVIGEEDIDWDKQPISRLRRNIVTNPQEIIGKSPRHVISQGRPIRTDEIASPTVVSKGMQVTLFYRSQNIEIKTFGEALDAGAVGDVVRVRNTASKAVIQGTVESGDRVRVTSPDMSSAEAM